MHKFLLSLCSMTLLVSCAALQAEGTCDCIQQSFSKETTLKHRMAEMDTCLVDAQESLMGLDEGDKVEFKESVEQCIKDAFDSIKIEK